MSRYPRLICLTGPQEGQEYELTQEVTRVGRALDCDIVLVDPYASRRHAEIWRREDAYWIRDLESKNGVYVDGKRLGPGAGAWLDDGTVVQFASTRFRFHDPGATITAPSLIAARERGLRVDPVTRQVYVDGRRLDPPLSPKQFDLLWYLYQNRGRPVSKDEIAAHVWSEAQGDVYDANIDRMVSRIRSRVEPPGQQASRFIRTLRGYGYLLVPEGEEEPSNG